MQKLTAAQKASAKALDQAWMRAPRERRGRCTSTIPVPGQGPSCRTNDGLWKVTTKDGRQLTTHGPDVASADIVPQLDSPAAPLVVGATAADISCVNPATTENTLLVYAYPSNKADRSATIVPALRSEAYQASAFLNSEAVAAAAGTGARLKMRCDGSGEALVVTEQLPTVSTADTFATIVADLTARGYAGARTRFLVFYDDGVGGYAGQGYLYNDDTAASSNDNNSASSYAIQYATGDLLPHWGTLLHEAGHNMGAVQTSSPNDSGGGHCNDGLDIMCYSDGGSTAAYSGAVCVSEMFDCGRNDYFHPSPAGGSYLATKWNSAASYNAYLDVTPTGAVPSDHVLPTAPGTLSATPGMMSIGLSWAPATDNVAVTGYRIFRNISGTWWQVASTAGTSYTMTGLYGTGYELGVAAIDSAGNLSARATVTASPVPDTVAPSDPTGLIATATATSIKLMWDPSPDNGGSASRYYVYRANGSGWLYLGQATALEFTARNLKPGVRYRFAISAGDDSGNNSEFTYLYKSTGPDTVAPTAPRAARVIKSSRSTLTLSWRPAGDNGTLKVYRVYRKSGSTWKLMGTTTASRRVFTAGRLRSNKAYRFSVRAVDAAGNLGRASVPARGRTR